MWGGKRGDESFCVKRFKLKTYAAADVVVCAYIIILCYKVSATENRYERRARVDTVETTQ